VNRIVVVGAGSFGTAIANSLAFNSRNKVLLLARDSFIVDSINSSGINPKYFPYFQLNKSLFASIDKGVMKKADIIFLAIPSSSVIRFISENKIYINPAAIIVNLAKGFGEEGETLVESLEKLLTNRVITMKGPTFADELIRGFPSAFTVGSRCEDEFNVISNLVKHTNIRLDFSFDVFSVEILSILKNIYAIALGIVDAHFNSANTRNLVLTRAFREIRKILRVLGGEEEALYKYCGIGDFTLTGLNDLSRNRTLGLMIGKKFLSDTDSQNSVVLEGVKAIRVVYNRILSQSLFFPIISLLYRLFEGAISVRDFIDGVLSQEGW